MEGMGKAIDRVSDRMSSLEQRTLGATDDDLLRGYRRCLHRRNYPRGPLAASLAEPVNG